MPIILILKVYCLCYVPIHSEKENTQYKYTRNRKPEREITSIHTKQTTNLKEREGAAKIFTTISMFFIV